MRLAVSNIAWPAEDRVKAYALLERHDIEGLEIAPALFFAAAADPFAPTPEVSDMALAEMRSAGLHLVSMQSLLFGVVGAALFGNREERGRFATAMNRAIDLAGRFGIPNLVFGSPRQRVVPDAMSAEQARDVATGVFGALGDAAQAAGCVIAIEPNPAAYGTNFLTRTADALAFVQAVDHPAITLNLDVGALLLNEEFANLGSLMEAARGRFSHVHFSEPHLAPAPERSETAAQVFRAAEAVGYDRWFSIEMKTVAEAPLPALELALGRLSAAVAHA